MLGAVIVIGCIIGTLIIASYVRHVGPRCSITTTNIPDIISQLKRSGGEGHFVVLLFVPFKTGNGEAVNLQYSIENGVVGLDWVLLSPRNIADQQEIKKFAAGLGFQFEEHEQNDCRYLRVVGPGIGDLGVKIIQDFYKMDPDTTLNLITEGFKWQIR